VRWLILSDIHANWEALEAVTAAMEGSYDACLCLGDVVGYGADPNPCVAWVAAHCQVTVRGNHDIACSHPDGALGFNPLAAYAAHWTAARLTPEARAWLLALPAGPLPAGDFQLVHGSPLDEDQYLVHDTTAQTVFSASSWPLVFFGHTHLQGGFASLPDRAQPLLPEPSAPAGPNARLELVHVTAVEPDARLLVNPGSVGQPRDGDWRAACALYDQQLRRIEFHRVPYDLRTAQRKMLAGGLPPPLALRLAEGR